MSDCCNTTAWVDVTLKSGKPLSFCYHHFAQHELALMVDGAKVVSDRRGELEKMERGGE